MMLRRAYPFVLLLAALSCRRPTEFTVKGTLTNVPVTKVYLSAISLDNKPVLIMDSATVKNGKFELKGPTAVEALFRVTLGDPENGPWMGVIYDHSPISLAMDGSKNGDYTVKGSPASQRFHDFFDSVHVLLDNVQKYRDASMPDSTSGSMGDTAAARVRADQEAGAFFDFLAKTVKEDPSPVLASFALNFYGIGAVQENAIQYGVNIPSYDVNTLSSLSKDLRKRFPQSAAVSSTAEAIQRTLDIPRVGSVAPDLSLPDTSGKTFNISSLRGKYVLVDFWASWCGPCRAENPNVVKAYQEFKNKNFTVVGVSLDQQKDEWLKAIHQDHLTWTHISDLAFWQSKAVETFQFNAIPYNILLDPQGRIIATSLRGDALEAELHSVLQ